MRISGIGIDSIEIRRLRAILRKKNDHFILNTFTKIEREYCFSYRDAAPHFAGTFAAKEAVQKASATPRPLQKIEIRRKKSGKPEVWLGGRRSNVIFISISHNDSVACAIALKQV